jgi:gliding motility-associated-like protein
MIHAAYVPRHLRAAAAGLFALFLLASTRSARAQCDIPIRDGGYWFVAPEVDQLHGDQPLFMRIASYTEPVTATLSMPANPGFAPITVNIPAGSFHSIDLTAFKSQVETFPFNTVRNTGLYLEVTGVATAYYEVASHVNPAIFNLKGDVALGRHFFVPAQTAFVNKTDLPGRSGFVVVATEDDTRVTIRPGNNMLGHTVAAGPFVITLNKGQTWSAVALGFNPSDRLNGSEVESDKPIAVTIFDDNVFTPGHWDLCGDQLVPVEDVGTEYIAIKGNGGGYERIYVLAIEDNTQVFVDGSASPAATINRGQQYGRSFSSASHFIRSSKPTYVIQMAGIEGELGHSLLPPIGCSGVSQMGFTRTAAGAFGIMLLVEAGHEGSFVINGNPGLVSASSFHNVPGTGGAWKAYYSNLNLPVGQNFVQNTTGNFHMGILNNLGASTVFGYYTRFGLSRPNLGPDQIGCNGNLFPMNLQTRISADAFLWSDGSSADNLVVDAPGTYWVRSSAAGCTDQLDTISISDIQARIGEGPRRLDFCGSFDFGAEGAFPGSDPGVLSLHTDSLAAVAGTGALPGLTVSAPGTYYLRLEGDCQCASVKGFVLRSLCPPQLMNDTASTPEDTPVTIPVLANDSDPDAPLLPGNVSLVSPPANGVAVVNPDGTLTYTPNPDWNGLDALTYQYCDADGNCSMASVLVTVWDVNDPPIAVDDVISTPEDTPVDLPVLVNDSDPDGELDPGSLQVVVPPSNGTALVNPDGSITYTPNLDWFGTDSLVYQICDDDGACDQATAVFVVTPVNDPPVAVDDAVSTPEDVAITVPVMANDSDVDGSLEPGSVQVLQPPLHGLASVNPDGSITYTPNANWFGTDSLQYQVCDNEGACDQAWVLIDVVPVNDAPVAQNDAASTPEDVPVSVNVLANDYDIDGYLLPGSVAVLLPPANGTASVNPDGSISYTPDPDWFGTDSLQYQVCDNEGLCDQAWVIITVTPVNDPPLAVDDAASTPEDTPVTVPVLDNDSDVDGALDPGSVSVLSGPSNGSTLADPLTGQITYTPDPNWYGVDQFTYQVCDYQGACDQAVVTITVTPVNDPPVAVDDHVSTDEDITLTIPVLNNDYDIDGFLVPGSVSVVTAPNHGAASVNPDGSITYNPDADFYGTDSLTYQVCDNEGLCDQAVVYIEVGSVNDPPVAVDDVVSTPEDVAVTVNVLANDSDVDGYLVPGSVAVLNPPAHGTAVVNPDGSITYTPNPDWFGTDTLTYQVCDNEGACDVAQVTVHVTPVNDPPVAVDDVATTPEDTAVVIDVLANDSDIDGELDPSSVVVLSGPSNGTASVNPDGSITYTPNPNWFGTDSFVYQVCDDQGACDQATVTVHVTPVNDPPVAVDDAVVTPEDTPVTVPVLTNDYDIDGELLPGTVVVLSPAVNGTALVNPDGSITYTPNPNWFGSDSLQYQVCDNEGLCDQAWVHITVTPVNDAPVAVDDYVSTPEDNPVSVPVLANDYDIDGFLLPGSVAILIPPANGTASVNPDGSITYVPNPDWFGSDSLQYQVCDNEGLCDQAWVYIEVLSVNDPPVAVDDVVSTPEDVPLNIDVLANDYDSDGWLVPGSVLIVQPPSNGLASVNPDGSITYYPNPDWFGTDTLWYQVCDNEGLCDQAMVIIGVVSVNDPPVAEDDVVITPEDTPVDIDMLLNDYDVDGVLEPGSVVITSPPSNGTVVVHPDGSATYTPNPDWFGFDAYSYQVCDNSGACDTAVVTVQVIPVNDPPVAVNDTLSTPEDTPVNVIVLVNDYDIDGHLEPSTVQVLTDPTHGTVLVNADGTVTYTPMADWNGLDSFRYAVCDNEGACDDAWVFVLVTPVPDPPVALDDFATTPEDEAVTVEPLTNDFDADNDIVPGSLVIIGGPSNGTAVVNPDASVTYTPNPDWYGTDTMQYVICDATGLCDTALIVIFVTPVPDAPVAVDDYATTTEYTAVDIPILDNDFDVETDINPGSVEIMTLPGNGSVSVHPDGSVTYTPNPGFFGVDSFQYVVCDSTGLCDDAWVFVTVSEVPVALIAVDDLASTFEEIPVVVPVLDNDLPGDYPIDPGTLTLLSDVAHGALSPELSTGEVTYTPFPGWCGTESFSYRICDTWGYCDTALVTISVGCVNIVANDDSVSTPMGEPVTITVLANDSPNAAPSCVTLMGSPLYGTALVNADGSVTYTPNIGFVGTDCWPYEVCDSLGIKRDDAEICVDVEKIKLTIPEVFTPNNDGFNDAFEIVGIEQYPHNQLMVFNRWENLVFQADGYASQWNGNNMSNGQPLPDGTYFYVLILDARNKQSPVHKGFVAIQR